MKNRWIILFRHKDTWKPGVQVYTSEKEAYKAAEQYSYSGQAVLVLPVIEFPGKSRTGMGSRII
jgi:hypothetical protein